MQEINKYRIHNTSIICWIVTLNLFLSHPVYSQAEECNSALDKYTIIQADINRYKDTIRENDTNFSISNIYYLIKEKSQQAINLLNICDNDFLFIPSSKDLIRWYQIGKHYVDIQDYESAKNYFNRCKNSSIYHNTILNGEPLSKKVDKYLLYCETNTLYSFVFNGKGDFYSPNSLLNDAYPDTKYFSEDVEVLFNSVNQLEDTIKVDSIFRSNYPDKTISLKKPFILVYASGTIKTFSYQHQPFTMIGSPISDNQRKGDLDKIYSQIIAPTYQRFYTELFNHKPRHFIPIYLCGGEIGDNTSRNEFVNFAYQVHRKNISPSISYFNPHDKSIVAWTAAGGGTLVHELIHSFIDSDFPQSPPWLNEGIAGLYESQENDHPIDNYRLNYIKEYTKQQQSHISLDQLINLDYIRFYKKDHMIYAAYARYFCYYLDDIGILNDVYAKLRESSPMTKKIIENKLVVTHEEAFTRWLDARFFIIDEAEENKIVQYIEEITKG